jgi:rubrerythrin
VVASRLIQEVDVKQSQLKELLLQALEHERAGIKVYETAVQCAAHSGLKEEWTRYLAQTREHDRILTSVCKKLELDPEEDSPGRRILEQIGVSLVQAMHSAMKAGGPEAAQLVACECVVLAETKDHADWELITKCAEAATGKQKDVLTAAAQEVEDQEDEHLYHTKGWCRELWLQSLGLKAVLPPPEERKHVTTAIGAARAEQASEKNR